jgi:hypothetical protein
MKLQIEKLEDKQSKYVCFWYWHYFNLNFQFSFVN